MPAMEKLFSYGTLQNIEVQLETFGRELVGSEDHLVGYRLELVEITDPAVLEISGERQHPIALATCDARDSIKGMVFEISAEELAHSDEYEVDDYKRVMGKLRSGQQAWVYVSSSD